MIQKKCSRCLETKPLGDFPPDKHHKDGKSSWCRQCYNEYIKKRRKANPEKHREINRNWCKQNREHCNELNRGYYNRILSRLKINGCAICGKQYTLKATRNFHFHHVEPELKSFGVNSQSITHHTDSEIITELQKCVLLCSKCHRKIHLKDN